MDAPNNAGAQVAADRRRLAEEQSGVPRSLLDRVDVVQARDPPCREVSATEVSVPEPAMTGLLPQRSGPTVQALSSVWAPVAGVEENPPDEELRQPVGDPVAKAPAPTVVVNTPIPVPALRQVAATAGSVVCRPQVRHCTFCIVNRSMGESAGETGESPPWTTNWGSLRCALCAWASTS